MTTTTPPPPARMAGRHGPPPDRSSLLRHSPLPRVPGESAGFTMVKLPLLITLMIAAGRLLQLAVPSAWTPVAAATVWALRTAASWITVLAGACLSWVLATGSFEHGGGELTFTGADRGHAVVLALAALVALLVRARARSAGHRAGA